ncbi:hypothetical protein D3C80_1772100 [compost metagenome]
MLIDSISLGFKIELTDSSIGKPSTTYNGEFCWVKEFPPLITIFIPDPGCPSLELTCTPAILPASACSNVATGAFFKSSILTSPTEPVRSLLFTAP